MNLATLIPGLRDSHGACGKIQLQWVASWKKKIDGRGQEAFEEVKTKRNNKKRVFPFVLKWCFHFKPVFFPSFSLF